MQEYCCYSVTYRVESHNTFSYFICTYEDHTVPSLSILSTMIHLVIVRLEVSHPRPFHLAHPQQMYINPFHLSFHNIQFSLVHAPHIPGPDSHFHSQISMANHHPFRCFDCFIQGHNQTIFFICYISPNRYKNLVTLRCCNSAFLCDYHVSIHCYP